MCEYMPNESMSKYRAKLRNQVPTEEPELEQVEEQPLAVNA